MTAIYVISISEKALKNEYKLGSHTGTKSKLLGRYRTYFTHPILYYYNEAYNSYYIEGFLKNILDEYRIVNENGNKSEWLHIELGKLIEIIDAAIHEYPKTFMKRKNNQKINNNQKKNVIQQTYKLTPLLRHNTNKCCKYKCEQCEKEFTKKDSYNKHLRRKNPCVSRDSWDKTLRPFGCDTCNATFTKKYNLDRHIENIHAKIDNKNSVDKYVANKNDTIIHHDTIPFGMDGISTLSLSEQCEVFGHGTNSIESILLKINLNENKPTHHNVCISSLSKGYGFIFNGSEWVSETINTIMTTILVSKERDLNLIYENIRETLPKELNTFILYKLKECRCTISNKKTRKTLIQNLKKTFIQQTSFCN